MSVLVIGASLIGSQVAHLLVEEGRRPVLFDVAHQEDALADIVDLDRVTLVQGSILRPMDLVEAIRTHEVTDIVHLAANAMLTKGAQENPYAAIELNVMGTVNLLEAARVHDLRRVVVASSSALAEFLEGGEDAGEMQKEEAFPRPTTFYAATKQAKESLGINYVRWCRVDYVGLRFASVGGPWRGRGGGGAPSAAFRSALDSVLSGKSAVVPARTLEWLYVKDAARAVLLALGAEGLQNRVFNVGMGRVHTPEQLISAIAEVVPGAQVEVEPLGPGVPATEPIPPLDLRRTRRELGYEPAFDMVRAIEDYARWWRALQGG
jgi:nucleoside-diphosphate-sugar epimerase